MEHHCIYITPAGFICTCSAHGPALSGGEASRQAHLHQEKHKSSTVTDLRRQRVY